MKIVWLALPATSTLQQLPPSLFVVFENTVLCWLASGQSHCWATIIAVGLRGGRKGSPRRLSRACTCNTLEVLHVDVYVMPLQFFKQLLQVYLQSPLQRHQSLLGAGLGIAQLLQCSVTTLVVLSTS